MQTQETQAPGQETLSSRSLLGRLAKAGAISWILLWSAWTASTSLAQGVLTGTTNALGELVLTNHCGDLNDDGRADVLDVIRLNNHLHGTPLLSLALAARADLDQDSKITEMDRTLLVNMILQLHIGAADDFDGDGLSNAEEIRLKLNPFNPDTDGDGWSDGAEVAEGTDPLNRASMPAWTLVAGPALEVQVASTQSSYSGLNAVMSQPPVRIERGNPLTGTSAVPLIVSQPPVEVEWGRAEPGRSGPGLILARPPVQIELPNPASEQSIGPGPFLALPPLSLELGSGETGQGVTPLRALPGVGIELPAPADLGLSRLSLYLAQPPTQIKFSAP